MRAKIMRTQVRREQQWNQLALLQVELIEINKETKPFLTNLVDEVAVRLRSRETRTLGNLPPWGYRCLGHSLRIELAIAQMKLGKPWEEFNEIVQNAYDDCLYFLRSDLLFLKSWDSTDPAWISEHWDINFSSIVNASFLSVATFAKSAVTTSGSGKLEKPIPMWVHILKLSGKTSTERPPTTPWRRRWEKFWKPCATSHSLSESMSDIRGRKI